MIISYYIFKTKIFVARELSPIDGDPLLIDVVCFLGLGLFVSIGESQQLSLTVTQIVVGITSVSITYVAQCPSPPGTPGLSLNGNAIPCNTVSPNTLQCIGLSPNSTAQYDFSFMCGIAFVHTPNKLSIKTYAMLGNPIATVIPINSRTLNLTMSVDGGNPALTYYDFEINGVPVITHTQMTNIIFPTDIGLGSHPVLFTAECDGFSFSAASSFIIYQDLIFDVEINKLGSNSATAYLNNISGNDSQTTITYYLNDNAIQNCTGVVVGVNCNLTNLTPDTLHTLKVYGVNGNHVANTTHLNFTTDPALEIITLEGYQTDNSQFIVEYTATGGTETPLFTVYVNGTVYCEEEYSDYCNIPLTEESLISQHTILLKATSSPDSKDDQTFTYNTWRSPKILNITGVVNDKGQIVLEWESVYGNPNEPFKYTALLTNDINEPYDVICDKIDEKICTSNSTGNIQNIIIITSNDNFDQTENQAIFNFTLCASTETPTGPLCSGHGICGNGTLGCTCNQNYNGTLCQTKIGPSTTGSSSSEVPVSSSFSIIYGSSSSSSFFYFLGLGLFVSPSQSQTPSITVTNIVAGMTAVNITYETVCLTVPVLLPRIWLTEEIICSSVSPNTVLCPGLTPNTNGLYYFYFQCGQVNVNTTNQIEISTFPTFSNPIIQVKQITSKSINIMWSVVGGNPALTVVDIQLDNIPVVIGTQDTDFNLDINVGLGYHMLLVTFYSGDGNPISAVHNFIILQDLTYDIVIGNLGSNSANVKLANVAGNDAQTVITYYIDDVAVVGCIGLTLSLKCNLTNLAPDTEHTLKVYGVNGNLISNTTYLNFTTDPALEITSLEGFQSDNSEFTLDYAATGGTDIILFTVYVNGTVYCEEDYGDYCTIPLTEESLISQHTILLKATSSPDSKDDQTLTFNTWRGIMSKLLEYANHCLESYQPTTIVAATAGITAASVLLFNSISDQDFRKQMRNKVFSTLRSAPGVKEKVKEERKKIKDHLKEQFQTNPKHSHYTLPLNGIKHDDILEFMDELMKIDESKWKDSKVSGCVYLGEQEHSNLLNKTYAPKILNITGVVNDKGQIVLGWESVYGNPNEPFKYTALLTNDINEPYDVICDKIDEKICTSNLTGNIQNIIIITANDNFDQTENQAKFDFTLCASTETPTGPLCSGHGICGNGTLGCTCNSNYNGTLCQTKIEPSSSSEVSSSFSIIYGSSSSYTFNSLFYYYL
ncbi:sphingosine-1-phosphate lyase [Cavenderia fasciculata]|uniref:Sphingosine-1-phosphate lyase n=1 Tax=Cavenderia fasciculata TaxID=261658 RepID=F4PIM9_CACFS|nr:sphingosine-1-phosphate lyase [Cavenderia fasciculata]EGG24609.1 sphingosine-1-phosphate lyase [Cavenderia fasciculata]|eukprot:XP_004362460.1 sphingosine-1-phosphate lyase [Cavenderia fasciculata]